MSLGIVIMGESGSGKTTSMRNLNPKETFYIDADGNGLNWKGWRNQYNEKNQNYYKSTDQEQILKWMKAISEKKPSIKNIVIDTLSSIMIADERRRTNEKGYDKWADLAWSVYDIVTNASQLRDDLNVIMIAHTQTETDDFTGQRFTRILTNGKKLNKIGLEKYFNVVLLSKMVDGQYVFVTRDPNSTCKTPYGAFESEYIPNDIVEVINALKDF